MLPAPGFIDRHSIDMPVEQNATPRPLAANFADEVAVAVDAAGIEAETLEGLLQAADDGCLPVPEMLCCRISCRHNST